VLSLVEVLRNDAQVPRLGLKCFDGKLANQNAFSRPFVRNES
jgi:hypothetical protein